MELKLVIKDDPMCDFVAIPSEMINLIDQEDTLNYHSLLLGFLEGCLRVMAYHPTVTLVSDALLRTESEENGESRSMGKM